MIKKKASNRGWEPAAQHVEPSNEIPGLMLGILLACGARCPVAGSAVVSADLGKAYSRIIMSDFDFVVL